MLKDQTKYREPVTQNQPMRSNGSPTSPEGEADYQNLELKALAKTVESTLQQRQAQQQHKTGVLLIVMRKDAYSAANLLPSSRGAS